MSCFTPEEDRKVNLGAFNDGAPKKKLVTEEFQWTPVSEKLPETNTLKIVTVQDTDFEYITLAYFRESKYGFNGWIANSCALNGVSAWANLPKPYKLPAPPTPTVSKPVYCTYCGHRQVYHKESGCVMSHCDCKEHF